MRNNVLIIVVALFAVLMCLLLAPLLFYAVTPKFLVLVSSIISFLAGVFITVLVQAVLKNIRARKSNNPA